MVNNELIVLKIVKLFLWIATFKSHFLIQKLFSKTIIFLIDIILIAAVIGVIEKLFKDMNKNNGSISENVSFPQINFSRIYMIYTLFPKRDFRVLSININGDYFRENIP